MQTGAITNYIDVAQLTLYAFWIFFACLIYYLRTEDKREGYPLVSERSPNVRVEGFPPMPKPKLFLLPHGGTRMAPRVEAPEIVTGARPIGGWPGAPLQPTGNPMVDGVGAAAYAKRPDVPDHTFDTGAPKIVPLRAAPVFSLAAEDPDPRGMKAVGADGKVAGIISDVWVDQSEFIIRYLEVEIPSVEGGFRVLVPMNAAKIDGGQRRVTVRSILADQFAAVPKIKTPNQITMLEEDMIMAYYGGGELYATAARLGPLL
jgi:photosynthetic reaction center H subunit